MTPPTPWTNSLSPQIFFHGAEQPGPSNCLQALHGTFSSSYVGGESMEPQGVCFLPRQLAPRWDFALLSAGTERKIAEGNAWWKTNQLFPLAVCFMITGGWDINLRTRHSTVGEIRDYTCEAIGSCHGRPRSYRHKQIYLSVTDRILVCATITRRCGRNCRNSPPEHVHAFARPSETQ